MILHCLIDRATAFSGAPACPFRRPPLRYYVASSSSSALHLGIVRTAGAR